ncbi:MAG: hypothetical protein IPI72_11145 [Flavobacteriales bacterium]|nr:hypothetical protein [Flavobacteriales bacterium]
MRTFHLLLLFLIASVAISCSAQDPAKSGIKNARTVTVKIDGDCPMCETRIEQVVFVKNEAEVDWVVETHMARVTFDSTRTDLAAIMQRVAHAGYDNELYLAPKQAYDKLPGCCQYERTLLPQPGLDILVDTVSIRSEDGNPPAQEVPSVFDKPDYKGIPEDKKP